MKPLRGGGRLRTALIPALCVAVIFAELLWAGTHSFAPLYNNSLAPLYNNSEQTYYQDWFSATTQEQAELKAEDSSAEVGAYRLERIFTRAGSAALNEGMARGFNQISTYSSSQTRSSVTFLNALGYSDPAEFSVRYTSPQSALDALLGIKYVSSWERTAPYLEATDIVRSEGMVLYKNTAALALAYGVSADVLTTQLDYISQNPFEMQNKLVSALVGRDVEIYKQANATPVEANENVKSWDVELPEGVAAYTYVVAPHNDSSWMNANGGSFEENTRFNHAVRCIGVGSAEKTTTRVEIAPVLSTSGSTDEQTADMSLTERITAMYEQEADKAHLERFVSDETTCLFYYLDEEVFNEVLAELGQHQMDITTYKGNRIAGSYEGSGSGYMLLTVPFDTGWTVVVNGEQVEAASVFDGAMMAIPVNAGTNEIELTYVSPGFIPGCIVSAVTLLALLVLPVLFGRKRSLKER